MADLFSLETKILHAIIEVYPYSYDECRAIYHKCLTFDKTIQILDVCSRHGIDPNFIEDIMEVLDKKWLKE